MPEPKLIEVLDVEFRGDMFSVTATGCPDPCDLLSSHMNERQIREQWWDIRQGDVVFDIGAGYGSWTFPAMVKGAYVFAFEPDSDRVFNMLTNMAFNGLIFTVLPVVVAHQQGNSRFNPGSHSVVHGDDNIEMRLATTVDLIVNRYTTKLDWIKIDVEGAELMVLQGATDTLKQLRPKMIIEYHPQFVKGIVESVQGLLTPLGYKETRINDAMAKWEWK